MVLPFLNTQVAVTVDNADMSRSQVVFLRSVMEQYGPKGVHILIVDASASVMEQPGSQDMLINYSYDWYPWSTDRLD